MNTKSRNSRRKRHTGRSILFILVALLLIIGVASAIYLKPYPPTPEALASLHSTSTVTESENDRMIAFLPHISPKVGLVFYPGAKVEPAAYAISMQQLAEHGYATFIVKMPVNIALLDENAAADVIAAYPQIKIWAVGGHSLGGVAACDFALSHAEIKGLLLYASYPNSTLVQRSNLDVLSISASNDGLATPAKIDAAKTLLPKTTSYIVIQGSVHAYFGDYGPQDGDGQAIIPHDEARTQIIAASLQLLDRLAA